MAHNEKKDAINAVVNKVRTSRTNLGMEEGSTKPTSLSESLTDAWTSTYAQENEDNVFNALNNSYTGWQTLESKTAEAWAAEPEDVEDNDIRAKWNTTPPQYAGPKPPPDAAGKSS